MDLSVGIYVPILIAFALCSGIMSSQLYLQPSKQEHGYFTDDSFFITCFTTDENIDQLKWVDFDGNEITATEGRIHVQPADGIQQGLRLVVAGVQKQDAGSYTCSDDHDSVSFDLIVYRSISFSDTSKIQHAPDGENAVVLCDVHSDPKPVVNWYFNGSKIMDNLKYKITDHGLTIHNVSRGDAGDYKCKAFVITPLTSQVNELDITLHVQFSPELLGDQKTVAYASIGTLTNLSCSVTADPTPMFQWIREDETLHNSSDYMIFNTANRSILQMTVEDAYQLGDYICRASNNLGWKEVTIDLKEGNTPLPPQLSVIGEDQETIKLKIQAQDNKQDDELKVIGFKVEYILSAETWDMANSQEFEIGGHYHLKNMSHSSEYVFRAAARNAAGYGDFSGEVEYTTHSLQVASVIADSGASNLMVPSLAFFLSLMFISMFY